MHFQKQDLEGTHYNWLPEEEKTLLVGQPTRRPFDKFNGDQVLFVINFFGSLSERFTIQEGRKLERAISYYLPEHAKSEISVFNWIRNNCDGKV